VQNSDVFFGWRFALGMRQVSADVGYLPTYVISPMNTSFPISPVNIPCPRWTDVPTDSEWRFRLESGPSDATERTGLFLDKPDTRRYVIMTSPVTSFGDNRRTQD
jgi:hypothetical protein